LLEIRSLTCVILFFSDTRNHLFFRDPLEVRFAEEIRKYFSSPVYKLAAEIAATNSVPTEKFKPLGLPVPELPNLADVILEAIPKAASLHVQSSDFDEKQRFAEIAKDLEKRLKTDPRYTHLGDLLKKLPQTSYEDFASWKNSARQNDPDANLQVLI
jgi:hypothetical protein